MRSVRRWDRRRGGGELAEDWAATFGTNTWDQERELLRRTIELSFPAFDPKRQRDSLATLHRQFGPWATLRLAMLELSSAARAIDQPATATTAGAVFEIFDDPEQSQATSAVREVVKAAGVRRTVPRNVDALDVLVDVLPKAIECWRKPLKAPRDR